jgi:3D (Asp-Asp-Asp) domain-containing protein
MSTDWGSAVVVDPHTLQTLRDENERLAATLARSRRRSRFVARGLGAVATGCLAYGLAVTGQLLGAQSQLATCRDTVEPTQDALAALTDTHGALLDATRDMPSLGTDSWGRRFVVTKYVPRSPDYGRFNDGLTSTMKRADPKARIVAVDPKLIPYGSKVWIEGSGWFHAEDCGGAIKGYRLDVLTATTGDAMKYGKQDRFVIVVPPGRTVADAAASAPERLARGESSKRRRAG